MAAGSVTTLNQAITTAIRRKPATPPPTFSITAVVAISFILRCTASRTTAVTR